MVAASRAWGSPARCSGSPEHPTKPVKKWVNVAGASAGAILACYLATGHDAKDMVDLMKETKFGDFQDFPRRAASTSAAA